MDTESTEECMKRKAVEHPDCSDSKLQKLDGEGSSAVELDQDSNDQGEKQTESIDNETNESKDTAVPDEYAYLNREGFTSEIFKIELRHLSKKATPVLLKKFILSKDLEPKKVKLLKLNYEVKAYVSFGCEEDREKAISVLNGVEWKGMKLLAKPAQPKADPMQVQKKKMEPSVDDDVDPEIKLKNSVTPLWSMDYDKQLERKFGDMKEVVRKLGRVIDQNNKQLVPWFIRNKRLNGGLCCPLAPVLPSPVREGYRNKCEFTIGTSLDGKDRVVGFRYGKYRGGSSSVGEPDCLNNISQKTLKTVKHLQSMIRQSIYDVFEPETNTGHWRMLLARTTVNGQMMAAVEFHPQNLSQAELEEVKTSLKTYFRENASDDVTSLFFHVNKERTTGANDVTPYELLLGEADITETCCDLKFRISPLSFFQVNTRGAEVLYEQVAQLCCAGPRTTVLDVCCGTGTIGLTMAKRVGHVIGVELVQSAIDDAIINAKLNGVENARFICGKAEDVMPDLMDTLDTDDVVAVVDPPRAGLHLKVVQALRKCERLKRLVYVSCNPTAALANFTDLCRAESKRCRGGAFVPVRAVCVDLFPDTPHCELVILFERYDAQKHMSDNKTETETVTKSESGDQQ